MLHHACMAPPDQSGTSEAVSWLTIEAFPTTCELSLAVILELLNRSLPLAPAHAISHVLCAARQLSSPDCRIKSCYRGATHDVRCAGYNSRMALYVLDEFLNSFGGNRIKLATIAFGTNDAAVKTDK